MTVEQLCKSTCFYASVLPDPNKKIEGVYCGDLLSWIMGHAQSGNAWVTIMSNINVIAVASLTDVSCVILAESVHLPDDVLKVAKEKGINIIETSQSSFSVCKMLGEIL